VISSRSRCFCLLHSPHTASGTHLVSYAVSTRGSFPGSEVAGHDTDQPLPSGAESENVWKCTLSLPDCSVGNEPWCFINHLLQICSLFLVHVCSEVDVVHAIRGYLNVTLSWFAVSSNINSLIAQICEPGVMLVTLNVNMLFLWGVTLCHSIVRSQHFEAMYCPHCQGSMQSRRIGLGHTDPWIQGH
jgi:hypothetical protein